MRTAIPKTKVSAGNAAEVQQVEPAAVGNPQQVRLSTEESADCINVQLFDGLDHPGFQHEPSVYAFFSKLLALTDIRIDAAHQALDALDDLLRRAATNGNGKPENNAEIRDDCRGRRRPHVTVTSQFAFAGLAAPR